MHLFFFFGDSVTLGVNDAPCGGWVARLAGKAAQAGLPVPPDTFYNMGVRKNTSRSILARWEQEYEARAMEGMPVHFVFCFGTVDMVAPNGLPLVPVGESAANARDILQKASRYGRAVLVSAPPVRDDEHNQRLDALCTAYASICRAEGMPFVDIFHPLRDDARYMDDLADGIHPGEVGNERIAQILSEAEIFKDWFSEKKH